MGFWSAVGSLAKAGMESADEFNRKSNATKERYQSQNLSEDEMKRKFQNASTTSEKAGIAKAMKEKGCGE